MKTTEFDKYWEDKANWKMGMIYSCKEDPRIVVPKKPRWMGRTLNFAHAKAYWCLILTFLLVLAPALLIGRMDAYLWRVMYLLIIVALIIFYYVADIRAE